MNYTNSTIVGGFMITNSEVLSDLKKLREERKKDKDAKYKKDTSYYVDAKNAGGSIFNIDPNNLSAGPTESIDIFVPSGLYFDEIKRHLLVGSDHNIKVIKYGNIIRTINHDLFNCIHGLSKDENGNIIVVSTGIDTLLSLDVDKEEVDLIRNANQNGFDYAPYGYRNVDLTKKHQGIDYPTMRHTTHINSAISHKKGYILATLFHQGTLIEIDIKTGKTNEILSGLKNPHSIKMFNSCYSVCDTGHGIIYVLNNELKVINKIHTDSHWIQDAQILEDSSIIYCDGSNGKIERVLTTGEVIDRFSFGDTKRIGWIIEVQKKYLLNIFG